VTEICGITNHFWLLSLFHLISVNKKKQFGTSYEDDTLDINVVCHEISDMCQMLTRIQWSRNLRRVRGLPEYTSSMSRNLRHVSVAYQNIVRPEISDINVGCLP